MESVDGDKSAMTDGFDEMAARGSTYASQEEMEKEIALQKMILETESRDDIKPGLAIKLARLLEWSNDYAKIIEILDPYRNLQGIRRCELLQLLGYALCKVNRNNPDAVGYLYGRRYLEESLSFCRLENNPSMQPLRKQRSLYARGLSRLGWALEIIKGERRQALEYRRQAYEHHPSNPHYLADMLCSEILVKKRTDLSATLRTAIREGIATCRSQADAGIDLPNVFFSAGRLSLLLDESMESLDYYARGLRQYLSGEHFPPKDQFDEERNRLKCLNSGNEVSGPYRWVEALFDLAEKIKKGDQESKPAERVLIITGGAKGVDSSTLAIIRPLVDRALAAFHGKVISGGTVVGVPGLVGKISAELAAKGSKHFQLIGYIPEFLPHDEIKDERYDRFIVCGSKQFSPDQILRSWQDLLDSGIYPRNILLLGFGGGPLSALEYRLALAFGASVGLVTGVGGAADDLMKDTLWSQLPNLLILPFDEMTIETFVRQPGRARV